VEEYTALVDGIKAGTIAVSNAIDAAPATDASVVVNYID